MPDEKEIDRYLRERREKLDDKMSRWIAAKKIYLMKKDDESDKEADRLLGEYFRLLAEGEGMEIPKGWKIGKRL